MEKLISKEEFLQHISDGDTLLVGDLVYRGLR